MGVGRTRALWDPLHPITITCIPIPQPADGLLEAWFRTGAQMTDPWISGAPAPASSSSPRAVGDRWAAAAPVGGREPGHPFQ